MKENYEFTEKINNRKTVLKNNKMSEEYQLIKSYFRSNVRKFK